MNLVSSYIPYLLNLNMEQDLISNIQQETREDMILIKSKYNTTRHIPRSFFFFFFSWHRRTFLTKLYYQQKEFCPDLRNHDVVKLIQMSQKEFQRNNYRPFFR